MKKLIDAIKLYCEIALHDSDINKEYPITEKDIDVIYNMILEYEKKEGKINE